MILTEHPRWKELDELGKEISALQDRANCLRQKIVEECK